MKNLTEKITLISVSLAVGGLISSAIGLAAKNYELVNKGMIMGSVGLISSVGMFGVYANKFIKEEEEHKKQIEKSSLQLNAGTDYFGD
jgi:uncharacterized membrane protein